MSNTIETVQDKTSRGSFLRRAGKGLAAAMVGTAVFDPRIMAEANGNMSGNTKDKLKYTNPSIKVEGEAVPVTARISITPSADMNPDDLSMSRLNSDQAMANGIKEITKVYMIDGVIMGVDVPTTWPNGDQINQIYVSYNGGQTDDSGKTVNITDLTQNGIVPDFITFYFGRSSNPKLLASPNLPTPPNVMFVDNPEITITDITIAFGTFALGTIDGEGNKPADMFNIKLLIEIDKFNQPIENTPVPVV